MARVLLPYGTSFVAVQTFAALWRKFCRAPYGESFAALWPSTNKQNAVQNPGSKFFFGCVCLKVSPRTACCYQKARGQQMKENVTPNESYFKA